MVDEHGQVWLVDFDRAEAAASQALLDRDPATLLTALEGVADPALVHASAEQTLGPDTMGRMLPLAASTQRGLIHRTPAPEPASQAGRQLEQRDDHSPR